MIARMAFGALTLWVVVVLIYGLYRAMTERPEA